MLQEDRPEAFRWFGERTRPRPAAAGASRRKTLFGETPNTTRKDAYAPRSFRKSTIGQ